MFNFIKKYFKQKKDKAYIEFLYLGKSIDNILSSDNLVRFEIILLNKKQNRYDYLKRKYNFL